MPPIRLSSHAYDSALWEFVTDAMKGLSGFTLIGEIPHRPTRHGGSIRNVPSESPVDHELSTVSANLGVHRDVLRTFDVDSFVDAVCGLWSQMESQRQKVFYSTISDVAKHVGNEVNAQGGILTHDHLIDAIEMISMGFDDTGKPHPLTLAGPFERLAQTPVTEAQRHRLEEVIDRKRQTYFAQKRRRRIHSKY